MRKAAIDFLAERQVPRLLLPATGRWNTADFFVPSVQLHIEVKGVLTFDSIRKLGGLARAESRYYLYQHNDWAWHPWATDWPEGSLSEAEKATLRDRAAEAERMHNRKHPTRKTKAGYYSGGTVAFARGWQQAEVLLMSQNPKLAGLASLVTRTRLDRYIHNGVSELHLVGLALGLIEPLPPGK